MGQSVSNQLGANVLGMGVDPDYVRQQIIQNRERQFAQITNPQQQLAARLGGLLGGGISNVVQGRGFFDISDPLLDKVTQISGIYNQVAQQINPSANPEEFFTALQKAYADAGLGQQAIMAGQEANKARTSKIDLQAKELQLLERDVESIPAKIQAAQESGNMAEAQRLANIYNRIIEDRQLNKRAKEAGITRDVAAAESARATAESKDIIYVPDGLGGRIPVQRVGDKFVPVTVEGLQQPTPSGQGQGKFSQGQKRGVYNPQTGRVEYK